MEVDELCGETGEESPFELDSRVQRTEYSIVENVNMMQVSSHLSSHAMEQGLKNFKNTSVARREL